MSHISLLYCRVSFPFYEYKYRINFSRKGYGEIVFQSENSSDLTILVANNSPKPMTGCIYHYPERNHNCFIDTTSENTIEPQKTQIFIVKYVMKYTTIVLKGYPFQNATVYFQGHYYSGIST